MPSLANLVNTADVGELLLSRDIVVPVAAQIDLILAVPGKVIKVLAMHIQLVGAGRYILKSNGSTIAFTSIVYTQDTPPLNYNPVGWLQTAEGEKLTLEHTGGSSNTAHVFIQYVLV